MRAILAAPAAGANQHDLRGGRLAPTGSLGAQTSNRPSSFHDLRGRVAVPLHVRRIQRSGGRRMARRLTLAVFAAAAAAVWPVSAMAATAPSAPPQRTSAPYALPLTLHWTPANDPLNLSQSVYRANGPCTKPPAAGGPIATFGDNTVSDFTDSPVDGTYCYHIRVADLLTAADGPGVTVAVDTTNPTATVAVSGQGPGGVVSGTVGVSGTSADAVSGVASSVLHIGAVGACPAGAVLGSALDTTKLANGAYDVCNVVTDKAGHRTTATQTVTIANLAPLAASAPVPVAAPAIAPAAPAAAAPAPARKALHAPTKLSVVVPRARHGAKPVPVALHWHNPAGVALARVVLVINLTRPPRGPADASVVYHGIGTAATLELRSGQSGFLALYAIDRAGQVSRPARHVVSLAGAALRPLTGSVVSRRPRL
ncbi:MAG TPA: hypothetical protein VLK59_09605, partial [Solirubrobacteraceae bacterium]|nr:hypothetical protein [Solirubrobacteraceae bacterium]